MKNEKFCDKSDQVENLSGNLLDRKVSWTFREELLFRWKERRKNIMMLQ